MKVLRALRPVAIAFGFSEPDRDTMMEDFYSGLHDGFKECGKPQTSEWSEFLLPFLCGIAVCVTFFHAGHL